MNEADPGEVITGCDAEYNHKDRLSASEYFDCLCKVVAWGCIGMTRTCLVSLYSNGNVLAAISAVRWYNSQRHPNEDLSIVTVVNTPGLPGVIVRESGKTLTKIMASQGWPEPIFLTDQDMADFAPSLHKLTPYQEALRRFRKKLGIEHIDEIYYAHDIHGQVPGLAMNAFPEAGRILFGDGLGSVYNKVYHLALANGASREQARRALKRGYYFQPRMIKRVLPDFLTDMFLGKAQPFQADKAVLILPMDHTGNTLNNIELIVVPRHQVQKMIADCEKYLTRLAEYTRELLASQPPPYSLILLENISDANMTTPENEVSLYEESIRSHVPHKTTVFIKGHPLATAPIDEMLRSRLALDYFPNVISHEFTRYPIELWSELINACQVLSISYGSVTLTYLYGTPVVYDLNDSLIEKYIKPAFRESFRDADILYRGQLANLANWDGQSVLWKGSV